MLERIVEGFGRLLKGLFGSRNERVLKELVRPVGEVGRLEGRMKLLTDAQLAAGTAQFRGRLDKGESLEDILPEAFAAVREAARRAINMRHFDVQVLGGIVLHQGTIAEMVTGEGKTLVATLPAYLNALTGKGVHIVTVNDYLAVRDRDWMGPVYEFLGMTAGAIKSFMPHDERQAAYDCDITFGQNNEFGFDYLRDNMEVRKENQVQPHRQYAIVDEVDSILIDEARTPLIISGPAHESSDKYYAAYRAVKALKPGTHYEVKEKERQVNLTEEGMLKAEELVGVDTFYTGSNMDWPHFIDNALRAKELFKRDKDYVVQDGQVTIVDEFTGRLMEGRTWSDGLHQAIEAKERLKIKQENQTLATITFQNFFKLYDKIAGMTGTAMTEAPEFASIYDLDVVEIPTNKPLIRTSHPDQVFLKETDKYAAIVDEIIKEHSYGRPLLVGTISIEKSEALSKMLAQRGIDHEVLNAKQHAREAQIIAKAGQAGHVTIATNMAGRGTDIVLGEGVAEMGGLHIIATERHEARRIDNQLRGRAGRQGDPGSSKFFLSLEDDLMRVFAPEWAGRLLEKFGAEAAREALEHPMITRAIQRAQKRVEEHNYDIRKQLLEYDEVMNEQRTLVYSQRQDILEGKDVHPIIMSMIEEATDSAIDTYVPQTSREGEPDPEGLAGWALGRFGIHLDPAEMAERPRAELSGLILNAVTNAFVERQEQFGPEQSAQLERFVLLQTIDMKWKDHLYQMDQLRRSIGLRSYGQKDPKLEYKREGYVFFEEMNSAIADDVTNLILKLELRPVEPGAEAGLGVRRTFEHSAMSGFDRQREEAKAAAHGSEGPKEPFRRAGRRIGRNEPCPCGSGKKYKKCCGATAKSRT